MTAASQTGQGVLAGLRNHGDKILGGASVGILLLALPAVAGARLLDLLIITLLFAAMAAGLHLVVGLCQLFDLGYAGFVCIGAYTTGILLTKFHWSYLPAAVCAFGVAMAAGVILGLPTLPLRGDYFAIVTFGFAEIVILLMRNWTSLTGGPYGLGGIPDPVFFGLTLNRYPPFGYYYFLLLMASAILLAVWLLRRTMLGAQMVAVGDDEKLCVVTGIDVVSVKVSAFALSAGIGGLIGSFWAVYFKFLSYIDFTLNLSVQVIAIVILAGDRRIRSLLLATAVIAPTSELLRTWLRSAGLPEASRIVFFGVILILLTLWRSRRQPLYGASLLAVAVGWLLRALRLSRLSPISWERPVSDAGNPSEIPVPGSDGAPPIRSSDGPAINTTNLHVSFGGAVALDGINLSVERGETIAVVGLNGSGKTSLLNAVSGLIPSKGTVKLNGRDITKLPDWLRARLGVVRTFQFARRFYGLDWEENLRVAIFTGAQRSAGSLFARLGSVLGAASTWLPLSKRGTPGNEEDYEVSVRLQTERAFSFPGSVILLDEPLAGRPDTWREHVLNRIRQHKSEGGVVIIVEHNLEAILPVTDRILLLDKGRMSFLGTTEDYSSFIAARNK